MPSTTFVLIHQYLNVRYLLKIHILFAKIYEKIFLEKPGQDPGPKKPDFPDFRILIRKIRSG